MDQITHTVFLSAKCQLKVENDYRSVIATSDIKVGDLLLVEHCCQQDKEHLNVLKMSLLYQEDFFNELYPRISKWSLDLVSKLVSDQTSELLVSKIQANSFGAPGGEIVLGRTVSWFNHDDFPNAYVYSLPVNTKELLSLNCIFASVIAGCDTKMGEEIFIKYGDYFKPTQPSQYPGRILDQDPKYRAIIPRLVQQYMLKKTFTSITLTQIANYHGFYMNADVFNPTPRFTQHIGCVHAVGCIECIETWLTAMETRIRDITI